MSFSHLSTYEEEALRHSLALIRILLAMTDHLLRNSLRLFSLRPCGGNALMFYEGGDEIPEERSSVRGLSGEMSIFDETACHC